jgi:hypothetical protein
MYDLMPSIEACSSNRLEHPLGRRFASMAGLEVAGGYYSKIRFISRFRLMMILNQIICLALLRSMSHSETLADDGSDLMTCLRAL